MERRGDHRHNSMFSSKTLLLHHASSSSALTSLIKSHMEKHKSMKNFQNSVLCSERSKC